MNSSSLPNVETPKLQLPLDGHPTSLEESENGREIQPKINPDPRTCENADFTVRTTTESLHVAPNNCQSTKAPSSVPENSTQTVQPPLSSPSDATTAPLAPAGISQHLSPTMDELAEAPGNTAPLKLMVVLPPHRETTPEIPDDIMRMSRLGDASRSTAVHKTKKAAELYGHEFDKGLKRVREICMEIAKVTGKLYSTVEADMFAAVTKKHKKAPKAWDVFITQELEKRNTEREEGEPALNRTELQKDPEVQAAYRLLTEEMRRELIEEGLRLRELKSTTKKWGSVRSGLISSSIDDIHEKLIQLFTSTGVVGIAFFACYNTSVPLNPIAVTGLDSVAQYFELVYNVTVNQLAGDIDIWSVNKYRALKKNGYDQAAADAQRRLFRHTMKNLLLLAFGIKKGDTNEVGSIGWDKFQWDTEIKYRVRLMGFDPRRIQRPSVMALSDITEFMEGADSETVYFKIMTPHQVRHYEKELEQENVGKKKRKKRSDTGLKRKAGSAKAVRAKPSASKSNPSKKDSSRIRKCTPELDMSSESEVLLESGSDSSEAEPTPSDEDNVEAADKRKRKRSSNLDEHNGGHKKQKTILTDNGFQSSKKASAVSTKSRTAAVPTKTPLAIADQNASTPAHSEV